VVKFLRTLSTRGLIALAAVVALLVVGGTAIAIASGDSGPVPPAKPLPQALHDGLAARQPQGVTARITFTNRLFPSGALVGRVGSALMSGASGRLWSRPDGRGRLELQSSAGDVQIVWNRKTVTIYDASSNTVYRGNLPASKPGQQDNGAPQPLSLAAIQHFLAQVGRHATLSGAVGSNVAGQKAYTVTASPRDRGGLLDSIKVAWDASHGVPLGAAIYAKGSSKPVLALEATKISYGAVPLANVDVAPPAGARTVQLPTASAGERRHHGAKPKESAAAGFPVTAPKTLLGLPRTETHVVGGPGSKTALVVYGEGLGAIVVAEQKGADHLAQLGALPAVQLHGATGHELTTPLGTILQWRRGDVTYLLAGSVPESTAQAAANGLR
jgi:outer membrane lipoprotein-sorting protein